MNFTFAEVIERMDDEMAQSLKPVIDKLEDIFDKANTYFYHGNLKRPVITVSPDTANAYGWCTAYKAWADKEDAKIDEGYYEINICSEYLSRPTEQVIGTLLHEMVHLYNLQEGIQDTSRGGKYHNKKFKAVAEAHGLTIEKDEKYGWTKTSLNEDGKKFLQSLGDFKFDLFRKKIPKIGKAASKQSSRKYVCPMCGVIIRATKEVHVICADCNEEFEEDV